MCKIEKQDYAQAPMVPHLEDKKSVAVTQTRNGQTIKL